MQGQIKKWGNSAAIRVPSAILDAAELRIDQDVDIRSEDGRIVIEPIKQQMTLEHLLAGISAENLHGEIDFESPVGRELL
jgi:antitoxin MazE